MFKKGFKNSPQVLRNEHHARDLTDHLTYGSHLQRQMAPPLKQSKSIPVWDPRHKTESYFWQICQLVIHQAKAMATL